MAKKDMGACMHEWKKEHPRGRAKKKMSKERAHKQAIAACLSKTNEGFTFKGFLTEMDGGLDVREYIRNLPLYQELIKNPQTKPDALKLARSFVDEFKQGADSNVQAYIADEFDDLYRSAAGKMGANVGDWEGERAYQARQQQEKDIESAARKWEQTTGMDAETGEDIPRDARGRVRHGARSGMEFRPEIKAARAARDLRGYGDQSAKVAQRAASAPAGERAYQGGESKAQRAAAIVSEMIGTHRPADIKKRLRDELDMTAAGANTYYYKYKQQALGNR